MITRRRALAVLAAASTGAPWVRAHAVAGAFPQRPIAPWAPWPLKSSSDPASAGGPGSDAPTRHKGAAAHTRT